MSPREAQKVGGPRIFLGTVEIAGYYQNLASGLRELGVNALFVPLSQHAFGYGTDANREPAFIRWTRGAVCRRAGAWARRQPLQVVFWLCLEAALRLTVLAWAVRRFEVFVYGFGTCITGVPRLEYPLLRLLRRRLLCVFHGSDTRPPYMDGALSTRGTTIERCIALTRLNKRRARLADRYAEWVVTFPGSAHFHERPVVNAFDIGVPVRLPERGNGRPGGSGTHVRILHSPSHPEAKGTPKIVEAVEGLKDKGYEVELVLVTGRPNSEVLEELRSCDMVVDQLYSDTLMAGFATEAASHGKPAVVGGYAAELLCGSVGGCPGPTVYCQPDEVSGAIERLVRDPAARRERGERARSFVADHWAPRQVAARFLRLLRNDVPAEWLFEPASLRYLYGSGLPQDRVRELVRGMIARGGVETLALRDKPELEALFLSLAAGADER